MSYTVLARRYRSRSFEELVGQDAVAKTLRGAIESGRIAHAYLFCGSRGVGKTSTARILAKCLNCLRAEGPTTTPCHECDLCRAVSVGEDMDVIEIDGASNNGVEQVRELRQNAVYRPARARFKIYIIDEVHMLSGAAFNALLKTLEEPPEHVKFFFATTEAAKLPITVRSRCQRFDFRNIATVQIAGNLRSICAQEGVAISDDALMMLARQGAGSMRDAVSLLDQVLSVGEKSITAETLATVLGAPPSAQVLGLFDAILTRDAPSAFAVVAELLAGGMGVESLVDGLLDHLRTMLLTATVGPGSDLIEVGPETAARAADHASRTTPTAITQMMSLCDQLGRNVRRNSAARALVDAAVWELCHFDQLVGIDAVLSGERPLPPRADAAAAKTNATPALAAPAPAAVPCAPPRKPAELPKPTQEKPTQEKPAQEKPAQEKPAQEKPAEPPKPTQEKPAPTQKPAPEKPAPEKPTPQKSAPAEKRVADLASVTELWPKLIEQTAAAAKHALVAVLRSARPVGVADGIVEIETADKFAVQMCEDRSHRDLIVATLGQLGLGRLGVKFRPAPAADKPSEAKSAGYADVQTARNHPLIGAALDLFGGRVVNVENLEKSER